MTKLGIGAAPTTEASGDSADDCLPSSFECEPEVVEQIRDHVYSGFQRVSRGGIEVAGVIFGIRDSASVRIVTTHPIFCEYKSGPTVVLSERDRLALKDFLESSATDPRFDGMEPLGWYVSHRTSTELLDRDLTTFNEFFDQPGQMTLIVRGERRGALPVAVFLRDANGQPDIDQPTWEGEIPAVEQPGGQRPVATAGPDTSNTWSSPPQQDEPVRRIRPRRGDSASSSAATQPAITPPSGAYATWQDGPNAGEHAGAWPVTPYSPPPSALVPAAYTSVHTLATFTGAAPSQAQYPFRGGLGQPLLSAPAPPPERRAKWEWLVAWAACLVLVSIIGTGYYMYKTPAPINLRLTERDGQIEATWAHGLREMFFLSGGAVEIRENGAKREFNLSKQQLESGSFSYVTDSQDVAVRLRVSGFGRTATESARFLGNRPKATRIKGASDVREERDRLMRDNWMLRANQSKSGEAVKQLEQRIELLEKMLKAQQAQSPE